MTARTLTSRPRLRAAGPPHHARPIITGPPANRGTRGGRAPPARRARTSSQVASQTPATTMARNAGRHSSRDASTSAASPPPTVNAATRSRPARPAQPPARPALPSVRPALVRPPPAGPPAAPLERGDGPGPVGRPTTSGTAAPPATGPQAGGSGPHRGRKIRSSELEQLRFLVLEHLVDVRDLPVGELVQLALGPPAFILAGLAVPDDPVELLLGLAADVADGHAGLLGLVPGELDHLPAPLLGHRWEHHPQLRALVAGVDAQVGVPYRLLHRRDLGRVVRLDDRHPRLRGRDRGDLRQRCRRPVVVDHDLGEDGGAGPARPDRSE